MFQRSILILLFLFLPAQAQAHALLARNILVRHDAAVVEFAYSDDEPAAFGAAKIFSPDNATVEFQNGRTDMRGRFAFSPDTSGTWTAVVTDGMGHKVSHKLEIPAAETDGTAPAPAPKQKEASMPLRIALGLSLIANIFMGLRLSHRNRAGN
jgi:nickel transport protein